MEVASKWNVKESGAGFVTRFEVRTEFMTRYEVHTVGARHHTEWWVPADELSESNDNIVGLIEVVREVGATQPHNRADSVVRRGSSRPVGHMDAMAKHWSDSEVACAVADYFRMLRLELTGHKHNKTAHRRALMEQFNNRSDGSVELKH